MKTGTPLLFRILGWFSLLSLAVVAYFVCWQHFQPTYRVTLTTQCEAGEIMRVWVSDNRDFAGSEPIKLWCAGGERETHSIRLGDERIRFIKILPPYKAGSFVLADVALHCDVLKRTRPLDLSTFQQTHVESSNLTAAGDLELTYDDHPGHAVLRLKIPEPFPAKLTNGDRGFYVLLALSLLVAVGVIWYVAKAMPLLLPLAACALVVVMATHSKFNVHPDEWSHLRAAAYYLEHDWFPLVDSPELESFTIPWCGISYAQLNDLTYPITGKVLRYTTPDYAAGHLEKLPASVIGIVEGWGWMRARWVHCVSFFLLSVLSLLAVRRGHRCTAAVLAFMLIFTPQVWYLFSYYNGDAFGFFLSCLPAILIVSQQDKLFSWLDARREKLNPGFLRQPLFWILALTIFLVYFAKKNYLICLPFYVALLALMAFERFGFRWRPILRALLPALLGIGAILLFAGYEHYRHDFRREARIIEYWNQHGLESYQPKNVGEPFFNKDMMMRGQGIGVARILKDTTWWRMIYTSSFGGYGSMSIFAGPLVYWLYGVLSLAFLFSWFWLVNGRRRRLLPLLLGLSFCLVALAQALAYSWVISFQPQGRYLLPILPMMAAALAVSLRHGAVPLVERFCPPLFALSCYSFVVIALPALADL